MVTYFTNATNLRATALCCGEPGRGRGIGVSATLAGLLSPCFRRAGENLLGAPIISDQLIGPDDTRASMRPTYIHRSTQ